MKAKVELLGMEFFARHGVLEAERRDGNTFRVDVSYEYDAAEAAKGDDLGNAVDYSDIYTTVRLEMEIPSDLLENVAYRIKKTIESEHPEVSDVKVSISKKNPPVGGPCEWSKVTI